MIEILAVVVLGFVCFLAGIAVGTDPETMSYCERCSGRGWHVWIEPTGDPSVYRGMYTKNRGHKKERVQYEVEGRGISDTLKKLAREIERVK